MEGCSRGRCCVAQTFNLKRGLEKVLAIKKKNHTEFIGIEEASDSSYRGGHRRGKGGLDAHAEEEMEVRKKGNIVPVSQPKFSSPVHRVSRFC
ncbi:hypothetical protein E2C01_099455 [Portunus trituberculatus]|uniref:Uncharacterized protein n=1 Tax=Portunus trituberculatus TaxID=210409 RepID=A0A5B7K3V8_PORTR|nr:hypothetical protein [Portunus trituberculatus]